MLTPGIEYFGVATDVEAVAFADGHARETPPIFWTEIGTLLPVAVLGALLTARPIAELASEQELALLAVEERDGAEIHLLRLPRALVDALAAATDEVVADVSRRARVYAEFRDVAAEDIVEFLMNLISVARRGGGLYARAIVPDGISAPRRDLRALVLARLPWVGLAVAVTSLIAGLVVPVVFVPALFVTAILTNLSVGALIRRRRRRHVEEIVGSTPGSVGVVVDADDRFLTALPRLIDEVLGTAWRGQSFSQGRVYLTAHPAGLELRHDGESMLFPAAQVLGITTTRVPSLRADFGTDGRVAALAVVLRIDDDESAVWEIPVLTDDGGRPSVSQLDQVAAVMAAIVGARV